MIEVEILQLEVRKVFYSWIELNSDFLLARKRRKCTVRVLSRIYVVDKSIC